MPSNLNINHFRYEGGEREHCLELWNRDGKVKHNFKVKFSTQKFNSICLGFEME